MKIPICFHYFILMYQHKIGFWLRYLVKKGWPKAHRRMGPKRLQELHSGWRRGWGKFFSHKSKEKVLLDKILLFSQRWALDAIFHWNETNISFPAENIYARFWFFEMTERSLRSLILLNEYQSYSTSWICPEISIFHAFTTEVVYSLFLLQTLKSGRQERALLSLQK